MAYQRLIDSGMDCRVTPGNDEGWVAINAHWYKLSKSMEREMRAILAALSIMLATPMASAQGQDYEPIFIVGFGRLSCASWLADSVSGQGDIWILGFWSGANFIGGGTVGRSTDAFGILGAIKKRCSDDPAASVISVASKLYLEFLDAGR